MDPQAIFDRLFAAYGPQHWWPAETPFEVVVGAILVQNTAWSNVEKAIENLREAGLLFPAALHGAAAEEIEEFIRPAGYYRVKARRLKNWLDFLFEAYGGDFEALLAAEPYSLREQLLGVNGIGAETADSIVLYAARGPIFVVDSYTQRVLKRHGWIEPEADYATTQSWFHDYLQAHEQLYNEFHALFVQVGKEHCRAKPRCEGCPLEPLLPEGGPCDGL